MKKYCNLQSYVQNAVTPPITNQPGLATIAEEFGIDTENLELHRALTDCSLTVMCVKKVYNPALLSTFVRTCDAEFYKRLFFKPKIISDIKNPLVNKKELGGACPECGKKVPGDAVFCAFCGSPMETQTQLHFENPKNSKPQPKVLSHW